MTLKEHKKLINEIDEEKYGDLRVWIDANCEEGMVPATQAFVANARFCTLDGDEGAEYVEYSKKEFKEMRGKIDPEYVEKGHNYYVYNNIIIIGDSRAQESFDYNRDAFLRWEENKKKEKLEAARKKRMATKLSKDPEYQKMLKLQEKFKDLL